MWHFNLIRNTENIKANPGIIVSEGIAGTFCSWYPLQWNLVNTNITGSPKIFVSSKIRITRKYQKWAYAIKKCTRTFLLIISQCHSNVTKRSEWYSVRHLDINNHSWTHKYKVCNITEPGVFWHATACSPFLILVCFFTLLQNTVTKVTEGDLLEDSQLCPHNRRVGTCSHHQQ